MNHFPFLTGKRVLLVSHELSLTGAPLLLLETATTLVRSGAEVSLINIGFHDPVFLLPALGGFRVLTVEESFAAANDADVIIANTAATKNWVGQLLTAQPGASRKLIWWIHEMQTEFFGPGMSCLSQACAAIFDSDSSISIWQQTDLPLPATTRVIHPGIAADFLRAADELQSVARDVAASQLGSLASRKVLRAQLNVNDEDFLVALFGSYCDRKGHDHLVETVGEMVLDQPDLPLKLLLIGFRGESKRQEFLNKHVEVHAQILDPARVLREVVDLKPYYLASDAFVMNTQDEGEAFGRVTIEAMAFGLPVLGTACGGTQEIVVDGVTGLLHPPGNEGESVLAAHILELLKNRSRAAALGEAGYRRVAAEFTDARFYHDLAEVFQVVMSP